MSSFTAWCPALLSLGQPLAKAGYMERLMRLMVCKRHRLALHTEVTTLSTVKLAGESDESASAVVVYGMVRGRLPVPNCGEHCSPLSFGQPMVTVFPKDGRCA